jgi:hypothetical protein
VLTASQCETVGAIGDGEIICLECARYVHGGLAVDRAREGLTTGADISLLSRYEADEWASNDAWERHDVVHENRPDDDEELVAIVVDDCGEFRDGPFYSIGEAEEYIYGDAHLYCGRCDSEIV